MSNFNFKIIDSNTGYNKLNMNMLFAKHKFYRMIDNGLAVHQDFFSEDIFDTKNAMKYHLNGAIRYYLYGRRKLICSTFLLKDGSSLFNLSMGAAAPLLPTISIPVHPSLFNKMEESDKVELAGILMRAHSNIQFANNLTPILTRKTPATYTRGRNYTVEQVVFVLECYMKAVNNYLSTHEEPNSDDFALEKKVFGDAYSTYISKESVKNFFEKFNIISRKLVSNKKQYEAISTKKDVSYQEIYNLFHCKTRFSVLAFLAIYKSLSFTDVMQDIRPFPYFIPVQYKVPGDDPVVTIAVCICGNVKEPSFKAFEKEVIGNNLMLDSDMERKIDLYLFMQDFMLKIKDSYLNNKKKHELEAVTNILGVSRYEALKRSYIAKLHQRAIQHDIDSHVLSKYEDEQSLERINIDKLKNYTPLQVEAKKPSGYALLARLNKFRTQLGAYCTDLYSGAPLSRSVITIRNLLATLDQNRLLMEDISGVGNSFRYRLKIFFDKDQEPAKMSDTRFDWPLSIPNDQLGCQAFYMLVNNVIRNTAKHAKRKNPEEEVSICIRFLKNLRTKHGFFLSHLPSHQLLEENPKLSSMLLEDYFLELFRPLHDNVEAQFYTVEIYSNVLQEDIGGLVQDQNERICEPFINEKFEERKGSKGLGEMACAAFYLRGKDVATTNEGENLPSGNYPLEDHNILNRDGQAVNLKAFALVADLFQSNSVDPEVRYVKKSKRWNQSLIMHNVRVTDCSNQNYNCVFQEPEEMEKQHSGFLGYRFFMLKPEQVLVVLDDKSTISSDKAEEVAKHVGVDVVSAEKLRSQLEKGVPVNHDILVCDNKELIEKYPAMLPIRILPTNIFKKEDFPVNGTYNPDEDDPVVVFCWKKWVDSLEPSIVEYNTVRNNDSGTAYFSDHLDDEDSFKMAIGYAEALSSTAQQSLPKYERNCRDCRGRINLANYFRNTRNANSIAHYRLLESFNTRILIVDERIQQKSQKIPSLGKNSKVPYLCHWAKCHIDLPDVILSESSMEDTAKKILDIIDEALKGTYYQFIFIHLGLLEGVFSILCPEDTNKEKLRKKMNEIADKGKGRVIFESGRGVPDYFPKNARFVQQTSAENALVEIKSKYMFTSLLHNSRIVSPTI